MGKIYYDRDANIRHLKGKAIGIIGYGIQGRAQALNMRDSGMKVLIANRRDRYYICAKKDGFRVYGIAELGERSDVVLLLIPDQAQADVYEKFLKDTMRPGAMLVFAHGYTLRYNTVKIRKDIDIALLAPRMPGHHIRNYFLKGAGVPAFIDVVQDATGNTFKKLLALAKAAGFTRAGALEVDYRVETDLDLFTEQFLVAGIVKLIHTGFNTLTKKCGYPAVPSLMELYASGELAEVLKIAAARGIGKVFQENASPTCQYGIADSFNKVFGDELETAAKKIMRQIQDGSFSRRLDREGDSGYRTVRKLWDTVNSKSLTRAHHWINDSFKSEVK